MTRISRALLVQRVDDLIVFRNESTGAEIEVPIDDAAAVIRTVAYLSIGLDPTVDAVTPHPTP